MSCSHGNISTWYVESKEPGYIWHGVVSVSNFHKYFLRVHHLSTTHAGFWRGSIIANLISMDTTSFQSNTGIMTHERPVTVCFVTALYCTAVCKMFFCFCLFVFYWSVLLLVSRGIYAVFEPIGHICMSFVLSPPYMITDRYDLVLWLWLVHLIKSLQTAKNTSFVYFPSIAKMGSPIYSRSFPSKHTALSQEFLGFCTLYVMFLNERGHCQISFYGILEFHRIM